MKYFFPQPLEEYEYANGLDIPLISPNQIPDGYVQVAESGREDYYLMLSHSAEEG